jgi:glycosyltransferase involved in cell wall biosynthesis
MLETNLRLSVCMLISDFYPIVGGGERQAQRLSAHLVERGVDVCVITRRYHGLPRFELVDRVPVYRVPIVGRGPLAASAFVVEALRLMSHSVYRNAILHCHQASLGIAPATIAALAKRRWGNRVIVKLMGSRVHAMVQAPTWPFRRWLLRHADVLVTTNDQVCRDLQGIGLDVPTHVLPNGVDTRAFFPPDGATRQAARRRLGLPSEDLIVLFVGRLDPVKALDVLLYAWALLVPRTSQRPTLALVGGGPEDKRLETLADQLDIRSSVHFAGPSDQVLDWYHGADLFVLPSHVEGLSNAMLEALACGLPVVATAVGGALEVIRHETNGLLAPPGRADALCDALLYLINDLTRARQLGLAARQTILARYSLDVVVDQYVDLYASLACAE